ncbi:MAG: hypothetical protein COB12_05905 [Flavobacterium sp.]|nr:MAG: hypothetical protein COB12_05905 [Flavobacterium sp.]
MINFVKEYIDNRIQLIKLGLVSVLANLTANLISSFLILLILLIILFMFSISLAYLIGQQYQNIALGFAIVGGIYCLIFIIYMLFAKDKIDIRVKNKIVQAAFAAEKELTEENND